ncbi:hypothetical protein TPHA_0J02940 [Tetrapisispora phaffii CBS 4417]|uniref:Protein PNS1 n=1 Tax=Tetrapisispora phaffii (strain ATCC 24235 / CBS 4417 / NBRC 1672 / NRRL Y-8282 / UCD 70-5) TaxID=1071381 RepID=G8BY64_TETPH|nr:hypothetical protein TPHA_0J02940 [Tetrapisispora phaffii CBS 4417]CCE65115.1 hypothetical protein TPHA_0J02940 [Tetrapisispora phaffii CBS 4417]
MEKDTSQINSGGLSEADQEKDSNRILPTSAKGNAVNQPPSQPVSGNKYNFGNNEYYNLESETAGAPIVSYDEKFPIEGIENKKHFWSRINDFPFTIFFILVVFGFIAVAALTLRSWAQVYSSTGSGIYNSTATDTLNTNSVILLVFVCVIAVIFGLIGLFTCYKFPKFFIYAGMLVNILSCLGTAIMYMSLRYWSTGIIFLVFTFFTIWCYWGMRSRIPLTVIILKTIMEVITKLPQIIYVQLIGTIILTAFSFLFSSVVVSTYIKYDPKSANSGCNVSGGSCSYSKLVGILVFVFFSGYYITEVIRNCIHVTISGIYGSWYYWYKVPNSFPRWPALGSFKRAMTTSFGSICFGSLIVTVIETIKEIVRLLRQGSQVDNSFGSFAGIAFIFLDWIISFLQWVAQYFNHYAYCFIALYGKPYLKSAKDTWNMLRDKGIDALINDNLINAALGFYVLFVSYMSTLFAFLYLRFTTPDYNSSGTFNFPLTAFSFLIAFQVCNVSVECIRSGVATFFVALSKDPEVYQNDYPEKFDEIFNAYPDVLDKLRPH